MAIACSPLLSLLSALKGANLADPLRSAPGRVDWGFIDVEDAGVIGAQH